MVASFAFAPIGQPPGAQPEGGSYGPTPTCGQRDQALLVYGPCPRVGQVPLRDDRFFLFQSCAPLPCPQHQLLTPTSGLAFCTILSRDNQDPNTRPPGSFLSYSESTLGILYRHRASGRKAARWEH